MSSDEAKNSPDRPLPAAEFAVACWIAVVDLDVDVAGHRRAKSPQEAVGQSLRL